MRYFNAVASIFLIVVAISHGNDIPPTTEDGVREKITDIQVDPQQGDDVHDGRELPVKTIARAIRLAEPGDTIHLQPGTYYESAIFTKKHGLPEKPITLDGHGAILDGSEPVTTEHWEKMSPGLYRRTDLYPKTDEAIVSRWYLLWDGTMQRMGRCSKGPSQPLKQPADLNPGEWTYAKDENAFYLKLAPGEDLDRANIRYPKRSSAVIHSHAGSWITVKNLTGTHVYNDGFNVHGAQRNLLFENIHAIECGDDGFSAHEDADCRINGFVSIGNTTGLCDTGTSRTHYQNLFVKDCVGFDLYFIGREHSVTNALIESRAVKTFWVDGNRLAEGQRCKVSLTNVVIRRDSAIPQELRIGPRGFLFAQHCTFEGVSVMLTPKGALHFQDSVFRKGKATSTALIFPNSIWQGDRNHYDFETLRIGQTSITRDTFSEFQRITGSETDSKWAASETAAEGVGANEVALQSLNIP